MWLLEGLVELTQKRHIPFFKRDSRPNFALPLSYADPAIRGGSIHPTIAQIASRFVEKSTLLCFRIPKPDQNAPATCSLQAAIEPPDSAVTSCLCPKLPITAESGGSNEAGMVNWAYECTRFLHFFPLLANTFSRFSLPILMISFTQILLKACWAKYFKRFAEFDGLLPRH